MTVAITPESLSDDNDPSQWEESLGATQRQGALLEEAQSNLNQFLNMVETGHGNSNGSDRSELFAKAINNSGDVDIVMAAESLRNAAQCLGRITGRGEAGDVEEVLGVVFEKYDCLLCCIAKY